MLWRGILRAASAEPKTGPQQTWVIRDDEASAELCFRLDATLPEPSSGGGEVKVAGEEISILLVKLPHALPTRR